MNSQNNKTLSSDNLHDLLKMPFPAEDVSSRKQAGKDILFVPINKVIERFNDVLGLMWTNSIVKSNVKEIDGPKKSFQAEVVVRIDALGTYREGIGAHNSNNADDALKGALAEATKKAAAYYGVGAELWNPARRIYLNYLAAYRTMPPATAKKYLDDAVDRWKAEDTTKRSCNDQKEWRLTFLEQACLTSQDIKNLRNHISPPKTVFEEE